MNIYFRNFEKWTKDEIKVIVDSEKDRISWKELSKILYRSPKAIMRKRDNLLSESVLISNRSNKKIDRRNSD